MAGRAPQHAAIEDQGVPRRDRNRRMLGIRRCHRAQIALHDAAEIFSFAFFIERSDRQGPSRLALERHCIITRGGHAEPLIAQLDLGRGTRRDRGVVGHVLPCLGRGRKLDRVALVDTHILRLCRDLRSRSLCKRKGDRLRLGNAAQREPVCTAPIIGKIGVVGLRCAVTVLAGDRHPLEIASLIGHGRERHLAIRRHRCRLGVDRSIDRGRRHPALGGLCKARLHRHVGVGRKRPRGIGAQGLVAQRAIRAALIPSLKDMTDIGDRSQRGRRAALDLVGHSISERVVGRRPLDMAAATRIHRRDRKRRPLVHGREGSVAEHHAVDHRSESHGHPVLIDPIFEFPSRMRNGEHDRGGMIGTARSQRHHAKARALGIRSDLHVAPRLVEDGRELLVLSGKSDIERAVAHRDACIVDPMREVIALPGNRDRREHIALVVGPATGRDAIHQEGRSAEDRRAGDRDRHLTVHLELSIIGHILRGDDVERGGRLDNRGALLVEAPPHKAIPLGRRGREGDRITRGKAAAARDAAALARGLVPYHDLARDGDLIRIGEHGLDLQDIVLKTFDQVLIKFEPTMGVTAHKRPATRLVEGIPTREPLGARGLGLQLHRISEVIGTVAAQDPRALDARAQKHPIALGFEGGGVDGIAGHLDGAIGILADRLALRVLPAHEGIAGVGNRPKRSAIALLKAAKTAHGSALCGRGDRAHRVRTRGEQGIERRVIAYGKPIGRLRAHAGTVLEPAHKGHARRGNRMHRGHLTGGIFACTLHDSHAVLARGVHAIALC